MTAFPKYLASLLLALAAMPACGSPSPDDGVENICHFAFFPEGGGYRAPVDVTVVTNFPEGVRLSVEAASIDMSAPGAWQDTTATTAPSQSSPYLEPVAIAEGDYLVRVFDPCRSRWVSRPIVVDTTPPAIAISPAPGGYRPPLTVSATGATSDDLLRARYFRFAESESAYVAITDGITLTASGDWHVQIQATDWLGNTAVTTAVYTVDVSSPAASSLLWPGNLNDVALAPRFVVQFDRPMDTSIALLQDAFAGISGFSADALVYWSDNSTANFLSDEIFPEDELFLLDIADLKSAQGRPLLSEFGLGSSLAFTTTTAASLQTSDYRITVTAATVALTEAAESAPLFAALTPPPASFSSIAFLALRGQRGWQAGQEFSFLTPTLLTSTPQTTYVRLDVPASSLTTDTVGSFWLVGFSTSERYMAINEIGLLRYSAELTQPLVDFNYIAATSPGSFDPDRAEVLLAFSKTPDIASFPAATTAELVRDGTRLALELNLDYLPAGMPTSLRATAWAHFLEGDCIDIFIDQSQAFDLAGLALATTDVSERFCMPALTPAAPHWIESNIGEAGDLPFTADSDVLAFSLKPGIYQLASWSLRSILHDRELPLLSRTYPLAPAPMGFDQVFLRSLADMDDLPDGLELQLTLNFVDHEDNPLVYQRALTVRQDADHKDPARAIGQGVVVRTPSDLHLYGAELAMRAVAADQTSLFLSVADSLAGTELFRNNASLDYRQNSAPLTEIAAGEITGIVIDYQGEALATFQTITGQAWGQRPLYILPPQAVPYALTPSDQAVFSAASTTFTWQVTASNNLTAIALRFIPVTSETTDYGFEFRFPPQVTSAEISLPDGEYYWLPIGIRNFADAFSPLFSGLLDTGYSLSSPRRLTKQP